MFAMEDVLKVRPIVEDLNKEDTNYGTDYSPEESEEANRRMKYLADELKDVISENFDASLLGNL